jgi:4-diphosphocytidyl-2-C-methyl-D-erythritol kinase
VAVATPAVFRARTGGFRVAADLPASWADAGAMASTLAACANDLEAPAIEVAPVIASVLAALRALPGVLLARMSGSGATCFALLASAPEAERAAKILERPEWWTWGGGVAARAPAT